MLLLRGAKMKDPNDYIVVAVWCVALICVLAMVGNFQATGKAYSSTFTDVSTALDLFSQELCVLEGTGPVQCNHRSFCDGKAVMQFVDTQFTDTSQTKRGSYVCLCKC